MEDPLSALHDRPHRYLLDSDSEDDETLAGPSRISKIQISTPSPPQITITGLQSAAAGPYEEVIIGVGQAGKYLARKLGVKPEVQVKFAEGGEVVGFGGWVGGRLVLQVDEESIGGVGLHAAASRLIKNIKTESWMVVSTYLPSMYIPDRPFSLPSAPVRALQVLNGSKVEQSVKGVEAITSPNYVTGLAAALMSKLIHPSTTPVPTSLILLPLPLSSLSNSELLNAISQLSQVKTELSISAKGSTWSEGDDEPYAQAGMGLGKNKSVSKGGRKAADVRREVDGMYM